MQLVIHDGYELGRIISLMTAGPHEYPSSLNWTAVLLYITGLFFSRKVCYLRTFGLKKLRLLACT